ncbi:hypothetical protein ACYULU_11775 [Breznakiellaceae bacterium SP9]
METKAKIGAASLGSTDSTVIETQNQYHLNDKTRVQHIARAKLIVDYITGLEPAKGIPATVVSEMTAGKDAAVAAFQVISDKDHAAPVDYRHANDCFANLHALLTNLTNHYFKVPPFTEQELQEMGFIKNSTISTAKPVPVGSCFLKAENTAPGQIRLRCFEVPGSLSDVKGGRKGIMVRSQRRKAQDPCQTNVLLLGDVDVCGRMRLIKEYGGESTGDVVDFSVAFKNGSGETGPFSPVASVIIG